MMNEIITGIVCCGIIFIVVSVVWVLAIMQKPEDGKRRRDAAYEETDRGHADALLSGRMSYDKEN